MGYKVAQFKGHAGQTVSVERSVRNAGSEFYIDADDAYLTKEQAPALALAILEAAGYEENAFYALDTPEAAVDVLRRHAKKQAEAKESEQLDKEAKSLYNASLSDGASLPWEYLEEGKDQWIKVALKARELHKGEAK